MNRKCSIKIVKWLFMTMPHRYQSYFNYKELITIFTVIPSYLGRDVQEKIIDTVMMLEFPRLSLEMDNIIQRNIPHYYDEDLMSDRY